MTATSEAHRHGRHCYWDHLRCGWVCRAGAAADGGRAPAVEADAPAPEPPVAEPVPAAAVT